MSSSHVVRVHQNGKNSSVIAQLISETWQFVQTRSDLFKAEIRPKLPNLRNATLLGLVAGLLLLTCYLLLALAAVVLIGFAFPQNPYRWFFGFAIVGTLSMGLGAVGVFLMMSDFGVRSILPGRTLRVLKADKDWVIREIHSKSDVGIEEQMRTRPELMQKLSVTQEPGAMRSV